MARGGEGEGGLGEVHGIGAARGFGDGMRGEHGGRDAPRSRGIDEAEEVFDGESDLLGRGGGVGVAGGEGGEGARGVGVGLGDDEGAAEFVDLADDGECAADGGLGEGVAELVEGEGVPPAEVEGGEVGVVEVGEDGVCGGGEGGGRVRLGCVHGGRILGVWEGVKGIFDRTRWSTLKEKSGLLVQRRVFLDHKEPRFNNTLNQRRAGGAAPVG